MQMNIETWQQFPGNSAAAYLAAIVESSDDAIISKSLDGKITTWNKAAERMFGYAADEAIGKHISIIIPFDLLDEEYHILDKVKRGKRLSHYETVRQAKDGRVIDVSVTVSPIFDGPGRIIGASKIVRDLSHSKCAERVVRLAAIVESSGDAIVARDLNDTITAWNAAAERLFGYTTREAIGNSAALIVPEEAALKEKGFLSRLKRDGRCAHIVAVRRAKGGRVVKATITLSPIRDHEGSIV